MRRKNLPATIAACSFCGRPFELTKTQGARAGNKYCSDACLAGRASHLSFPELPEWATSLLDECRSRAKKKGIEFSVTTRDMQELLKVSGWRCSLSGLPFEFDVSSRRGPHRPFSPSLDRIDSAIGYTRDNVRLVCLIANIAMNTWGENALQKLAAGIMGLRSAVDGYKPAEPIRKRGKCLPGVRIRCVSRFGTRYEARLSSQVLGTFDSELDAHLCYIRAKKSKAKKVALEVA